MRLDNFLLAAAPEEKKSFSSTSVVSVKKQREADALFALYDYTPKPTSSSVDMVRLWRQMKLQLECSTDSSSAFAFAVAASTAAV